MFSAADMLDVEDRIMALFERIASARVAAGCPSARCCSARAAPVIRENACTTWQLAYPWGRPTATRCWLRQSPGAAAGLRREAVETITAMVEFQLSGD